MSTQETKIDTYPYGRPINEIIRDLTKPIPESRLKKKKMGGKEIIFIS